MLPRSHSENQTSCDDKEQRSCSSVSLANFAMAFFAFASSMTPVKLITQKDLEELRKLSK